MYFDVTGPSISSLENDRGVAVLPVAILDLDGNPVIVRQVDAGELIAGKGRIVASG